MEIYIALRDSDQPQSFVVGAFSTEEKAEAACQEDENDTAEGWGRSRVALEFKDAEANVPGGQYAVVLVDLDVRTS